ncbi:MAG: molecular chaperone DnaJ [Candidatus Falkowbacteria bacterium]|nr:molecular chaperone DnaJ [Candidatus Falkowbacteria bacterium]
MGKDYYNILGVNRTATQEEIKKAFRQKAHQCHPDKAGGDEAKFKEINEAYQVLGDATKRSQYDQFGSTFEQARAGGGFQGFDGFRDFSGFTNGFNINMDDIGDIFGGLGDIFGFSSGSRRTKRAQRGGDIQMLLEIDFLEAVFGADKEISFKKTVKCEHCRGNCAEPGSKIETCRTCGGSGRITKIQRTILGNMQVQIACDDCDGEGKSYNQRCSKCHGSGVCQEIVNLKVKIPAGIDSGETIRLSGQGEAGERGASAGDLYLKIRVRPDRRFNRDGYDIKFRAEINFTQAALGDKIDVETVDGFVKLYIPDGTQSGTVFKLKGKGIERLQGRGRGDQLVEVIVKTPKSLSRKQKELLRELGNNY